MVKIQLNILRLDFQPSENLIEETVWQYTEKLRKGDALPPLYVRFDGSNYFLQDGFHRVEAARRVGITELDAEVSPGTLAEMESEFRDALKAIKQQL